MRGWSRRPISAYPEMVTHACAFSLVRLGGVSFIEVPILELFTPILLV